MAGEKKIKHKQIRVTLIRSTIETLKAHKACVKGLGLRKIRHSVLVEDTPCTRGMINRVRHLLTVEEA